MYLQPRRVRGFILPIDIEQVFGYNSLAKKFRDETTGDKFHAKFDNRHGKS